MSDISLQEAAARSGLPYQTLKKATQRGQLRARHEGARVFVDEDEFTAYMTSKQVSKAFDEAPDAQSAFREVGNVIGRLPSHVQTAILEGMPTAKKQGSPEPFRKAIESVPKHPAVASISGYPHFGHPIGYQHAESPRWKRTSESTWSLDGSSWSWNGFMWEGGGEAEGRTLAEGISPGNPYSDLRPSGPGGVMAKAGKATAKVKP